MKQPLHITIKQYRILYVLVVAFVCYMVSIMWSFYEEKYSSFSTEGAAVFSTMFLGMIGMLKFALDNNRQDDKHD